MQASGLTLLELLLVLAILTLLSGLAALNFNSSSRALALTGYANEFALAVQQSASRANTNNELYVIKYGTRGVEWGPGVSSLTLGSCETGSAAPALASTSGQINIPAGTTHPTGWLCISAPGLVTRLETLDTCMENGANVPCFAVRRGTASRRVLVSGNGQTEVK